MTIIHGAPDNSAVFARLEEAQAAGDARTYATICRRLAITQPPAGNLLLEGIELLAQDEVIDAEAAEHRVTIQMLQKRDAEAILAAPRNWGIRTADIATLAKDKRYGYTAAQDFYWAVHNIEIPPEMAARMTHVEILAKYWGTVLTKRRPSPIASPTPTDFRGIYRQLDGEAYKSWQFRTLKTEAVERFPTTTGEQQKRLEDLSEVQRKVFVDSFFAPSHSDYRDPNVDGADKSLYVRDAFTIIKNRYQSAVQQAKATVASFS